MKKSVSHTDLDIHFFIGLASGKWTSLLISPFIRLEKNGKMQKMFGSFFAGFQMKFNVDMWWCNVGPITESAMILILDEILLYFLFSSNPTLLID